MAKSLSSLVAAASSPPAAPAAPAVTAATAAAPAATPAAPPQAAAVNKLPPRPQSPVAAPSPASPSPAFTDPATWSVMPPHAPPGAPGLKEAASYRQSAELRGQQLADALQQQRAASMNAQQAALDYDAPVRMGGNPNRTPLAQPATPQALDEALWAQHTADAAVQDATLAYSEGRNSIALPGGSGQLMEPHGPAATSPLQTTVKSEADLDAAIMQREDQLREARLTAQSPDAQRPTAQGQQERAARQREQEMQQAVIDQLRNVRSRYYGESG